jgi:hypothetical protein
MPTLLDYCKSLPEIGGRASLDIVSGPVAPGTPYALIWDKPEALHTPHYGTGNIMAVAPCVAFYAKPSTAEPTAAQARLFLMTLLSKVAREVPHVVTLDSDGMTPFLNGSVQLAFPSRPLPDKNVSGQYYAMVQFSALIYRP